MKNPFFRLSLALISLLTMLCLLAACSDTISTIKTPGQTDANPTATVTVTPSATTAAPTATVGATTAPTATAAPVTTATALPTVTPQPDATAAPTVTPTPEETTEEPTAEPTATPTEKPVVTTAPPVEGTEPGTTPAATAKPATGPAKLPGKIVFEASGIFVVNPDGSGLKKIAEGHSPVFSPDGKRVAFISDDDSAINSVDLNGQNLQYHCPTEGHLARIIRWSPTGKWVAVDSLNEDGTSEVRLCDMTYKGIGALETVYRANTEVKLVFDWSLDEKKILWQSGSHNSAGEVGYDLWYSRPEDPISNWNIVSGRKYETELAEGYMYINARISPTNKTVAVIGNQLFFMSVPGYTSSYNDLVLDQFVNVDGVAWSPDSAAVLISGVYQDNPGMYLYYFESKKVVQLTDYLSSGYLDWTRK